MNELYNRYAFALLDIAKEENKIKEFHDEILSLVTILKRNPEIAHLLGSYFVSSDEKETIVTKVFSVFSTEVINFIRVIIKNGRAVYLYDIFKETLFRFDDYLGIERGIVYSTVPLDAKTIIKIKKSIENNTGKTIEIKNVIDPDLIGGIRVVLKNDIYDASIKNKVDALKSLLLAKGN